MFEPFRCGVKGKASYLPLALTFVPAVRSRKLVRSSTPDACSTVSGREGGIHVAIAPGLVVGFANCSPMQPGWRVRPERGLRFWHFWRHPKVPPTGLSAIPGCMGEQCRNGTTSRAPRPARQRVSSSRYTQPHEAQSKDRHNRPAEHSTGLPVNLLFAQYTSVMLAFLCHRSYMNLAKLV